MKFSSEKWRKLADIQINYGPTLSVDIIDECKEEEGSDASQWAVSCTERRVIEWGGVERYRVDIPRH